MRQRSGDVLGGEKDRRPNDSAHQQQNAVHQRKSANQAGFGVDRIRGLRQRHHCLSHPQIVGGFKRRPALAANDRETISAGERVGNFAGTLWTIEQTLPGLAWGLRVWNHVVAKCSIEACFEDTNDRHSLPYRRRKPAA